MKDARNIAEKIFRAGVGSVLPHRLIREEMTLRQDDLRIGDRHFDLRGVRNLYVVGAGKASGAMAREVEAILGNRILGGCVVVKPGHGGDLKYLQLIEAGHPTPDANSFKAAAEILRIAEKAEEPDLVLCLISGGGSALMTDCPPGAGPDDLAKVNKLLVRSGADIGEINTVRKHLSAIKGGQLARAVRPARLVSLILSDVIGDPLDVIASGPTVPDLSTFADALHILEKLDVIAEVPAVLLKHLKNGNEGKIADTPKPGDKAFQRVCNRIIGSNRLALQASQRRAAEFGLETKIVTSTLEGDSAKVAREIVERARALQAENLAGKDLCLLFGGETTIKVTGSGLGGRNQHLALAAAVALQDAPGITLLCAGTDGTDGPTDAAGAVVDSDTVLAAKQSGVDVSRHLSNFDSYHFFQQVGGQVVTGPTMTNVMDLVVVVIQGIH